uniref:Ubiquitin-like domain-containing protein n=1 Tax=Electrophorus electricus TaxID=8005 RepID=A0AAY5F4Y3_ELEEL
CTRSCTGHGSRSRCPELVHEHSMNLSINSTTGTRFELSLPLEETVEGLKRRLSQKLRVAKDRLALLHKDTRLTTGRLQDFGITDGSKLTLVPSVEAGLMVSTAAKALEFPVSDFLSGRSPLTLALRVGDHMMFVQLQLAAQSSAGQQAAARGPASVAGTSTGTCGGGAGHAYIPAVAHGSQRVAPGSHSHPPHLSPSSSPVLSPGSCGTPSSWPSRKPGAVIESFVNHAPGCPFSLYSRTLHPNCQDSDGRPRRDVSTILQILNDLLSATRHYQGAPPALTQLRCHTQSPASPQVSPPTSPATAELPSRSLFLPPPPGEPSRQTENRATRCKVERLQLLLRQRRLRRRARREPRSPYPWLAARKAARSRSASSLSSDGSLDLDYDEAVWQADVPADVGSEFAVA